nr:hydroxyacylglutathione hydrolase [uncultured Shimia sp.]
MPLEIATIPCLSDNYAFLIHDKLSGDTAIIDVPDAAPVHDTLEKLGWTLTHVLLTHHHWDHVDGLAALLKQHPATVIGAKADAHRLPALDIEVAEGDTLTFGDETATVIDVSGHTVGHIAFYFEKSGMVFTGDSLMALGCGRLFEGTPDMMFASLSKLAKLPETTLVCSGHEYTASNGRFAQTIDPDNAALTTRIKSVADARDLSRPTVPSLLSEELATNPFLRCGDPDLQKSVGMSGADPAAVFAEIRARKDNF